jgi:hypothetical protein
MANIQFDPSGNPYSSIPSPGMNKDTMADIQKSLLHKPGYYGDQELKNSHVAFNNAVQNTAQLTGLANYLKTANQPNNYSRTNNNYILSTLEKQAITNKCNELSSYGQVPYDTLETFFYILAAIDTPYDLQYVSAVTGIEQLSDRIYLRNVSGICAIPDIYKVGYLSQGVATVNQRYASQFGNVDYYGDYTQSSTGSLISSSRYASNLGVIGQVALSVASSFVGYGGTLSNTPSLSNYAITSAVNALSGYSSGATLSPQSYSAILNPTATVKNFATLAGQDAIGSLLNMTPLGGAMGSFGALGGVVASMLLGQSGGNSVGGYMSQVLFGQRMKSSQIANNPMLIPPSYAGKAFFGEAPVSFPAIDQVFCRRIGSFGHTNGSNGTVSFGMQNFGSFGGAISLTSMVSNLLLGTSEAPDPSTYMGQQLSNTTENIANVLNISPFSKIEPRRSDNGIPFLLGMSAALVGETFSPFGSKTFTEGWKLAASTGNDIQKYNPQYMEVCRTSL